MLWKMGFATAPLDFHRRPVYYGRDNGEGASADAQKERRAMSTRPASPGIDFVSVPVPIWREAFLALDWVALRASSVYRGVGIPHGDGAPVILIPGFLGTDPYLAEMHAWLKRIGYRPYLSGIGQNADCPNVLAQRLQATVDQAYLDTNRRAHLVGHSLGGIIARVAAVRYPERIAQVITLGSPVKSVRIHPFVLAATRFVRGRVLWRRRSQVDSNCYTGACDCSFLEHVREEIPSTVLHASIYTRSDGIVDWRSCLEQNGSPNIEVRGTHIGLAFNAEVYRNVATLLARDKPGLQIQT
jgi:triacylglycerol lipase